MDRRDHRQRGSGREPLSCRLFVYLASRAPVAVILRRGPSDWARLSLWRLDTDEVTHGQWLHARVYERRCDLSPDGKLFIAFVRDSSRPSPPSSPGAANQDSWLAVSRPPWFTALALWFVGGAYCAGGFFPDDRSLWLGIASRPPDQGTIPDWLSVTSDAAAYRDRTPNWTERTVWFNRLQRDGWQRVDGATPDQWRRRNPTSGWTLTMTIRSESAVGVYGGPYLLDYAARHDDGDEWPLGRVALADWDPRGRLIVARDGRLLAGTSPGEWREIADFANQAPAPAPAPAIGR